MKYAFLLPATSFVLLAGANAANLVVNGDFETGLSGYDGHGVNSELGNFKYGPTRYGNLMPDNWTRGPGEDRGWVVADQSDVLAGSYYSFRLDADYPGNQNGGPETIRQSGIVMTTGTYTFTADLWSDGSRTTGAAVLVKLIGTDGNTTGHDITIGTFTDNNANGIQEISQDFAPSVAGEYELRLSAAIENKNHPWVDNLAIVPEPSSCSVFLIGLGALALGKRRRN